MGRNPTWIEPIDYYRLTSSDGIITYCFYKVQDGIVYVILNEADDKWEPVITEDNEPMLLNELLQDQPDTFAIPASECPWTNNPTDVWRPQ